MQQQYQQQHLEQQQAQLLQAVPDFNNEKAQAMTQYLRGLNFTDEEIGTITDHRMVMVALKAQAYDEQQKSVDTVKKKVSKLPKITKPGKPESKAKVSRGKRARLAAKAKQTGHPDDAAAAIEHLI